MEADWLHKETLMDRFPLLVLEKCWKIVSKSAQSIVDLYIATPAYLICHRQAGHVIILCISQAQENIQILYQKMGIWKWQQTHIDLFSLLHQHHYCIMCFI